MLDFVQVFNMSSPGLDFLANNMSCFFSAFQIIGCLLLYMASSYTFLLAAVSFAGNFVMIVIRAVPMPDDNNFQG